jgi:pimeloyl-ACP methyl ester carboxylesterase
MKFKSTSLAIPGGAAVTCHEAGSGDPVLYIHGAAGLRLSPGLERLAGARRVVAPVIPGFNGTPRRDDLKSHPDLAEFAANVIDAAIGRPCDVIGHSMGAGIAAMLALKHPEKVQLLVLSGMNVGGPPANMGVPDDPAMAQNFAAAQYYRGDGSAMRALPASLGEIEPLTLILHGTRDPLVPLASPRLLKERIRHSHLIYVYDAGHASDLDQPERFATIVSDFLARGEAFIVHRSETGT